MIERGQRANLNIYDDAPTEEVQEEIQRALSCEDLIKRYAEIHQISIEQAKEEVGAPTEEEILKKIQDKTIEKINSTRVPMNRAQRRALKKKVGAKKYAEMVADSGDAINAVAETAKKLNYIDLIQRLRELNAKKEIEENGTITDENN